MIDAEEARRRWYRALREGGRWYESDWEAWHDKAAKVAAQDRDALIEERAAPLEPTRTWRPVMVPPDHIAIRATAFLGIEADYFEATAKLLALRAHHEELHKVWRLARDKAMPTADDDLNELEVMAMRQSGRAGEMLLSLINELRAYRSFGR